MTPAFIFGWLVATAYGALFHLIQPGNGRRLLLYLVTSWLGFAIGQVAGDLFGVTALGIGPVNMLIGTLGAWVALGVLRTLMLRSHSGPPAG
jgi:hypothetical protein